jgi:hypothetical protein
MLNNMSLMFSDSPLMNNSKYNPSRRGIMNNVMNELTTRFECDNCGKCKPARHFHDMVCSSVCDHQYRDGGFYMSIAIGK